MVFIGCRNPGGDGRCALLAGAARGSVMYAGIRMCWSRWK